MSMMKTLAKVAIGVALAKGASGMMKGRGGAQAQTRPGSGGLFGGTHSPQRQQPQGQQGGGLEDMLGSILGGGTGGAQQGGGAGGLGGLLEQLGSGHGGNGKPSGGLNDLLGGLAGAVQKGGGAGGLGGLLGGLMGAGAAKGGSSGGGGFGDLLNQAITRQDEPEAQPTDDQEAAAAIMLRAMIQAMKSDGEIDAAEQAKLMDRLGDVSPEERAFVQGEMQRRIDVKDLANDVPRGLEQQVYAMSVMGIDLDNQNEAQYLHQLATAMGVSPEAVNHIHDQLGAQRIYS